MESLVINGLIGIVTFIFAVLAIGPALLASDNRQTPIEVEEDRIVSIEPIPDRERPIAPIARPMATQDVL